MCLASANRCNAPSSKRRHPTATQAKVARLGSAVLLHRAARPFSLRHLPTTESPFHNTCASDKSRRLLGSRAPRFTTPCASRVLHATNLRSKPYAKPARKSYNTSPLKYNHSLLPPFWLLFTTASRPPNPPQQPQIHRSLTVLGQPQQRSVKRPTHPQRRKVRHAAFIPNLQQLVNTSNPIATRWPPPRQRLPKSLPKDSHRRPFPPISRRLSALSASRCSGLCRPSRLRASDQDICAWRRRSRPYIQPRPDSRPA